MRNWAPFSRQQILRFRTESRVMLRTITIIALMAKLLCYRTIHIYLKTQKVVLYFQMNSRYLRNAERHKIFEQSLSKLPSNLTRKVGDSWHVRMPGKSMPSCGERFAYLVGGKRIIKKTFVRPLFSRIFSRNKKLTFDFVSELLFIPPTLPNL